MKNWIKNLITVFVVLFCCFIMFLGVAYYRFEANYYAKYEANDRTTAQLQDVQAVWLGDTYQGQSTEGKVYYELVITLENPGNLTKKESEFWFTYYDEEADCAAEVSNVLEEQTFGSGYDNSRVLPAGKEGVLRKVICVGKDVEQFTVIYSNNERTQRMKVYL